MWYFSWILGTAMAILFAVVNAMWLEAQEVRGDSDDSVA